MLVLNSSTFDQELRNPGTLVIKFHADWCPDCRRIQRAYAGFPDRYSKLRFGEVNSEENAELARRFEVRGIPTFLVFRNGQLVDRLYSRDAKTVQQIEAFVARQAQ